MRHYLSIMIPCFARDFESHRTTTAYRYSVSASHFFFELLISQARACEENKAAIPESKFFQKVPELGVKRQGRHFGDRVH